MNPTSDESKEPVYEDFRELFAQKERLRTEKHARSPIGLLKARFHRGTERTAGLLERRLVLCLGGCLVLIFAGLSALLFQGPHRNRERSVDVTPSSVVSDVKDSHPLTEDSISEPRESFIIRIASFRDPSNAKRAVESLRKQGLEVKIEVSADGLQMLRLGPFQQKGVAEDAARSVRAIGLVPQVVRLDF